MHFSEEKNIAFKKQVANFIRSEQVAEKEGFKLDFSFVAAFCNRS